MTPLEEKLRQQIRLTGPISVAGYMGQCLFDPQHGYYTTHEPFGASGDFTTAPEISQMFGEMLAAWWISARETIEFPDLALVEIGPGRGTLMDDILRTIGKLTGGLLPEVHMVEISPRLAEMQRTKLDKHQANITSHASPLSLPKAPLGIIANELFDAIPIRQFVKTKTGWFERMVQLDENDSLAFGLGPAQLDETLLPKNHKGEPEGQIFECAPARLTMLELLAIHLKEHGGFALFIDYGHASSGFGDTLQAMRAHRYANVLEHPGETDLTSHVDFEQLKKAATHHGLFASEIMDQGEFLKAIGIEQRAEKLKRNASEPGARDIDTSIDRLTSGSQMGHLFKVLGLSSTAHHLLPLKFEPPKIEH